MDKIISIYGPTITKKTGLAVYIAKYIWGKYKKDVVIINADSRKVYKDLDIGQVKIDPPFDKKLELRLYRYLSLDEKFSLKNYKEKAFEAIDDALTRNKVPILLGGTGVCHLAVLENWNVSDYKHENEEYSKYGRSMPKYDYIVLSPLISKANLFKSIAKHIKSHFQKGIFRELQVLVKKHQIDYLARTVESNILLETIGYREFLEYAKINNKRLEEFTKKDHRIIERSMNRNLKNMARKQIRFLDKFDRRRLFFMRSFSDSKRIVDNFLV